MTLENDEFAVENQGQRWATSWHAGPTAPQGRAHGAAGLCLTDTNGVVLVSTDGVCWDFPAGRPEGTEVWEQTLRREMLEEACAVVDTARLLGFCRGRCIAGSERGLVLVRSIWLAKVRLLAWHPKFEMRCRCVVPVTQALPRVPPTYHAIWQHAFAQAGLC